MKPFEPPRPELVAAVRAEAERTLDKEAWEAARAVAVSEEERAEVLSMVEWFTRRYPTALARLGWARRQHQAAMRRAPPSK